MAIKGSSDVRRVKFAQVLFTGADQRAAAIAAGYKDGRGIDAIASRLVADPVVQAELELLKTKADDSAVLQRDEALRILTSQARGTMGDFFGEYTSLIPSADDAKVTQVYKIDLGRARELKRLGLIKKYSLDGENNKVTIELYDAQSAIAQLAKLQGWNTAEKHEVRHTLDEKQLTTKELDELIAAELQRRRPQFRTDAAGVKITKPTRAEADAMFEEARGRKKSKRGKADRRSDAGETDPGAGAAPDGSAPSRV